ncbi:NERD domain-containing protein [Paenibacillus hodogayensis]|uniref:NERD domain-containing protein n=1 Tax=Paenibacillus hodogayensis TaxID=279208 RepID=A0ABV5VSC4_9BACL
MFTSVWSGENYLIYIMAGLMLAVIILSKSPTLKGKIGEASIRSKLKKLDPKEYHVLHDIMIQQPDGKTTQIDHLVISRYGVFVIETKNYTGWIMGSERAEYWTQVIYKRKEKLYNPIRQNYGHIKALENFLGESGIPFISIISFSTRATLKLEAMSAEVIYSTQVVRTILKYKEVQLTEEQREQIYKALSVKTIHTREERKQHVQDIKGKLKETKQMVSAGICPKCQGELVERRGKNGAFTGCSNFPSCRYTKAL